MKLAVGRGRGHRRPAQSGCPHLCTLHSFALPTWKPHLYLHPLVPIQPGHPHSSCRVDAPPLPPPHLSRPPSLVPHGLDGLRGALVVVLLHVPVHGAQLHLPPEVDVHRALLHRGVDELVGGIPQLRGQSAGLAAAPGAHPRQSAADLTPPAPSRPGLTRGSLMPVMRSSGRSSTRKAARLAV